ncbi:DUF6404 family protein [Glaciimonas soli]|uniref:Uncharacterized protein n=1 Tax=Glaciimonas soli TaxID=2590999 RepID=A0A843YSG4_9BURK|nr:DUF6404 family protein [Glaciimonas soli]MQR02080.1 hypothetical protein [Glaciimonas soli]
MTYPPNINIALERLASTDMRSLSYAPPLHRLLWCAGISLPPPHLASVQFNCLFYAAWFSVAWGAFTWYLLWSPIGAPFEFAASLAVMTGGVFGYGMALYYRYAASQYDLPHWKSINAMPRADRISAVSEHTQP